MTGSELARELLSRYSELQCHVRAVYLWVQSIFKQTSLNRVSTHPGTLTVKFSFKLSQLHL